MFNYKDETYELKLNLKVVRQVEGALGKGIMAILRESGGMMSINDLIIIAGYGMYNSEGNRISPAQGMEIAEAFMIEKGYVELITVVIDTIDRDCPFFFPVD